MGEDRLIDLVPGLTAEDVQSDTGTNLVDVDPDSNPSATQARTFTLLQLTDLFNVLLHRSNVKSSVAAEEKASRIVEAKVAALE